MSSKIVHTFLKKNTVKLLILIVLNIFSKLKASKEH
jgi:hypothetical protein